jgi:D-galactarolactone isomerase
VEIAVPPRGLGKRLDAMHAFHAERGISACLGRGRHEDGKDHLRWYFADAHTRWRRLSEKSGRRLKCRSSARGVAVVDQTVTDAELDRLTKIGICGIRFHMLPGGALPWDILEKMAARVATFGWHVQLQLDGREFPEREAQIRRLTGTLVVDHVGKFLEPVPLDHPSFRVLMRLVENGRTWVKLSAPYEVSKLGPPNYDDVGTLAKALVKTAPDRMLWATNWPHPTPGLPKPDDIWMLDMLLDWVADEATRTKVLVNNPARLYGFV